MFDDAQIIEDFKTSAKRFKDQGADDTAVQSYISDFKNMKVKIKDAAQKDIDKWKTWDEFKAFVDSLKDVKTKGQEKREKKMQGAELVAEDKFWRVYKITTHDAAMLYGSGTKWCITQPDPHHWDFYTEESHDDFYFYISKRLPPSSPFYKIALEVDLAGGHTYWDATDKSHGKSENSLYSRDKLGSIPFKLPDVPADILAAAKQKHEVMESAGQQTESVGVPMLAKVIFFDKDSGVGVARTVEGHEYHIGSDSVAMMEQDALGQLELGMIVRVNPAATQSDSMLLAVEKVSKDDAALYDQQLRERINQVMPESKKKFGNLTEASEEEKEVVNDAVIDDLVDAFKAHHKDKEELRKEITDSLDFSKGRYHDRGDAGVFTVDGTEYNIIKSEDEAERIAVEMTKEDIENEPEIFNQDFLKSYLTIDPTTRRQIALDDVDSRQEDMRHDAMKEKWEDVFYATDLYKDEYKALQERLDSSEDKEETKAIDKEIEALAEKSISEWGDAEVDRIEKELEDPIKYLVNDQGVYTIEQLMKADFVSIDADEAAQAAVDTDGWEHFISLYNGEYNTTKNGYVYFRED